MTKLKDLRLREGKTQREMADIFNVSKSTYNYWETGKIEMDYTSLVKVSEYYNTSIDYLLGRESTYSIKTADNQFALNYGSLFDDDNFKRYVKIYSLLDTMQRMQLTAYVLGFVGQFGISYKDIS